MRIIREKKDLKSGLTLIEVLIASVIFAALLTAIAELFQVNQHAFLKTESKADAERMAAAILNQISARIRASDFILTGQDGPQGTPLSSGPLLFPPPPYNLTANEPNQYGDFPAMTGPGNYITLSLDPFGQNLITIQFYRPTGPDGGTIYMYQGNVQSPPPSASEKIGSGSQNPIEDLEFWYKRGWAVERITLVDRLGNLVQSSTAAFIRYYN